AGRTLAGERAAGASRAPALSRTLRDGGRASCPRLDLQHALRHRHRRPPRRRPRRDDGRARTAFSSHPPLGEGQTAESGLGRGALMQRHINSWTVNLSLAVLTALLFAASIYVGRGGELLADKFETISAVDRDIAWLILTE